MPNFQKAQRKKARLRLGIEGPSGAGKTYSALLIAKGLSPDGKIAVIDTENNSASLYSHLADFDVAELQPPFTPELYVELIQEAAQEYDVLVIDSISHEWSGKGGILEIHDNMPGNNFQNWAKVNPRHNAFMSAMLQAPCHVIATMRSKEQYILQENNQGKQEPKKAGMKEQQRDGVIYEFTTVISMDVSNQATRNKDRTELFQHNVWFVPTEKTGQVFRDWLESGVEPQKPTQAAPPPDTAQGSGNGSQKPENGAQNKPTKKQFSRMGAVANELFESKQERLDSLNNWLENQSYQRVESASELTRDQAAAFIEELEQMKEVKDQENQEDRICPGQSQIADRTS